MSKNQSIKKAAVALYNRFFGKKDEKVLNTEERIKVQVYKLDPDAIHMHSALGILEPRAKEISLMLGQEINKMGERVCAVAVMEEVSKSLTHPNELVLATWIMKSRLDRMDSPSGGGVMALVLGDILRDLNKKRGPQ